MTPKVCKQAKATVRVVVEYLDGSKQTATMEIGVSEIQTVLVGDQHLVSIDGVLLAEAVWTDVKDPILN